MDTFQHSNTEPQINQAREDNDWAAWRAVPRQLVAPGWRWLTLMVLIVALVFGRLGVWQLQRLAERRAENAVIASRTEQPALEITGMPVEVDALEYRRVNVRGTLDSANEVVLRTQSRNGLAGVEIVTPLRISGTDQSVLINRGWVPLIQYDQAALQQYVVTGEVTVEGILRKPQTRTGGFGPVDRQPATGRLETWFRVDVERIGAQVPYPLLPFFIEQLPESETPTLPYPEPDIQLSEGSHLNYAIQWFSFAAIALGGYTALVATRTRNKSTNTTT